MKKGKILSIMLVFLMMISFLPTNIYADDETKIINQLVVTSFDKLRDGLGDAADVSQDSDGHINIKLKKNLKGQLKLDIPNAYYVLDANGKTLDGACEDSTSGYVPESLCLEHNRNSTMVLKGNGTYKRGTYYAIFCGSGCKYIILSARLEGSIGSNGNVDVRTQLQDGYKYYTATKYNTETKEEINLFNAQNTEENKIRVASLDFSNDVYVFEQHVAHQHVSSDWIIDKEATTETEGSKHKECTECKEVLETEKIAKLENKETVKPVEKTDNKEITPTVTKEAKAETKTETATKAVKTGDSTNIIEVVCLLVFSLAVLTLVRKYC